MMNKASFEMHFKAAFAVNQYFPLTAALAVEINVNFGKALIVFGNRFHDRDSECFKRFSMLFSISNVNTLAAHCMDESTTQRMLTTFNESRRNGSSTVREVRDPPKKEEVSSPW